MEVYKRSLYFLLFFTIFFTSFPHSKLVAEEPCSCILVNRADAQRAKVAKVVAGATLLALIAGVAYMVIGSKSCHSHHHHRHHHHHHSYSYSYSYWDFSNSDSDSRHNFPGRRGLQNINPILEEGELEFNKMNLLRKKKMSGRGGLKFVGESKALSGSFVSNSLSSSSEKGSMTAFVRLPDGSMQILGSILLATGINTSIPYGPFTQKGVYSFGVCVEDGSALTSYTKVGSIEVNRDGLTTGSHDFFVPPHPPLNFEPAPFEYILD